MELMIALPMMTSGCLALFDRRCGGASILSGSSAVRGLRGVMRWALSGRFGSTGAALIPLTSRSDSGGYGSPATGTAFPDSREYDTDRGGEDSFVAVERPVNAFSVGRSVVATRAAAAGGFAIPFVLSDGVLLSDVAATERVA